MKHYILILSLLIAINSIAQNGGQYPENGSVKLEWVGSSVKVTNKQSCESVIKVSYAQSEVDLTIAANSSLIFMPPAAVAAVKAKTTTNCGGTDFGWVEISLSVMPVKFVSFDFTPVGNKEVSVTFETAETSNIKTYYILISKDGINYQRIDSIPADKVTVNRKYSIRINTSTFKK
jgi:hypothetical protein